MEVVTMRLNTFVGVVMIFAFALVSSLQAQATTNQVVILSGLIGKSPAEIQSILGKPNSSGVFKDTKIKFPIEIANVPDYFQIYKISNVKLGIWFYQNKPILFQSGFRESQPITLGSGNSNRIIVRQSLEEAFSSIGIDIKNQKPDEVRFLENATNRAIPLSLRTVVKIWKRDFNNEKWERIESRENEPPEVKVKFGGKIERFVYNVCLVPPTSK
jgi:hypothetical protein